MLTALLLTSMLNKIRSMVVLTCHRRWKQLHGSTDYHGAAVLAIRCISRRWVLKHGHPRNGSLKQGQQGQNRDKVAVRLAPALRTWSAKRGQSFFHPRFLVASYPTIRSI